MKLLVEELNPNCFNSRTVSDKLQVQRIEGHIRSNLAMLEGLRPLSRSIWVFRVTRPSEKKEELRVRQERIC